MEDLMTLSIHKKDETKVPSPIGGIHLYHHFSRGMFYRLRGVILEFALNGGGGDTELFRELFNGKCNLTISIKNSFLIGHCEAA